MPNDDLFNPLVDEEDVIEDRKVSELPGYVPRAPDPRFEEERRPREILDLEEEMEISSLRPQAPSSSQPARIPLPSDSISLSPPPPAPVFSRPEHAPDPQPSPSDASASLDPDLEYLREDDHDSLEEVTSEYEAPQLIEEAEPEHSEEELAQMRYEEILAGSEVVNKKSLFGLLKRKKKESLAGDDFQGVPEEYRFDRPKKEVKEKKEMTKKEQIKLLATLPVLPYVLVARFFNTFFSRVLGKTAGTVVSYALPLLLVIAVVYAIGVGRLQNGDNSTNSFGDSAVLQNVTYDSRTGLAKGELINQSTREITLKAAFVVYSNKVSANPIKLIFPTEAGYCLSDEAIIPAGEVVELSARCDANFKGFAKKVEGKILWEEYYKVAGGNR